MFARTIASLAVIALLFATATVSSAGKDESDKAFSEFNRLRPLAEDSATEASAKEVRKALDDNSPWQVVAAVEAVRQAQVNKGSTGRVFLPEILALLKADKKKLLEEEIVAVNVFACLCELVHKDDAEMMQTVRAVIDWQRWSENVVVRLRHMADRLLYQLTEQDCTLRNETVPFWEWWYMNKGQGVDKPPEKKSRTAPIIFKEPMIGTRVVFVIDVSDSMKWPINHEDLAGLQKKITNIDWTKLPADPSPMDLAKAQLAFSIDKLRPEAPDPKKKPKTDPEMRYFAIVTYSDDAKWFTNGWVEATNANCNTYMTEVDKLETEHRTNIHGGLWKAFNLSAKDLTAEHPEIDKECVLTGAHTILFLTDGYPTWSDDSKQYNQKDQFGNPCGDGKYVKAEALIELAQTLNRFRKVLINTVGIGNHDKKLMAQLAKDSGGTYTDWYCRIDNPK